eukprot:5835200-Prymnesium_polylepis.1
MTPQRADGTRYVPPPDGPIAAWALGNLQNFQSFSNSPKACACPQNFTHTPRIAKFICELTAPSPRAAPRRSINWPRWTTRRRSSSPLTRREGASRGSRPRPTMCTRSASPRPPRPRASGSATCRTRSRSA